MRKILATLALLAGALYTLSAVPAHRGKVLVKQPDGSIIVIQGHGDEWYHYVTDDSGRVVSWNADGFYRPAEKPSMEQFEEARQMRASAARMRAQARNQAPSLSQGKHRIPVFLVNFSDIEFKTKDPVNAFSNMLNQKGYSARGGTGSVRDYYYENSHGAYEPEFEVFGPVTLPENSYHYAGAGGMENFVAAVNDACSLLDDEIDFSKYDSNGDGLVDMLLIYYAGYNQAESHRQGEVWPHQSNAYKRNVKYDGKNLDRYFCTSELRGGSGGQMCGIGTTTHEFGHSLGLPDFYDTDYSQNGDAGALYDFSLMCGGSYNNDGRTPPYLNSEERRMLGWMGDQTEIPGQGSLTIEPVQNNVAYKTYTTMDGEYFVYECRTQTGWDLHIPYGGMLVYHVDKAERETLNPDSWWADYYTPAALWEYWESTNAINAFGSHPCFYLVPSADQSNLNYEWTYTYIPFPGRKGVTKYTPVDWQGEKGEFRFTDITFDGTQVTMTARLLATAGVQGVIRNTSARPVRGATVSIYDNNAAPAAVRGRMQRRSRAMGTPLMSVTTDVDGCYSLEDVSLADGTFTLVVTCSGYVEAEETVVIGRQVETRDFYLRKVGESTESTFLKYNPEGSFFPFGYGDASVNLAAGLRLSANEVAAYAGKQIKLISFQPYGDGTTSFESAYVFVEAGGKRVFTQPVDNVRFDAMNTVSVVSQEFSIPKNTDLVIGYALVGCDEAYPLLVQECEEEKAGYMAKFRQNSANDWSLMKNVDGGKTVYYTPVISASVGEPVSAELGFNYIDNPGNGTYKAGSRFTFKLNRYEDDAPASVAWKYDGQTVNADSVSLTAGSHTVEAHLTYPDGSAEVIRLVINAE
jgi:M6 family metalloprotease-like protein